MIPSQHSYGSPLIEIPLQELALSERKAIQRLEILLDQQAEIHFGNDITPLSHFRWKTRNFEIVVYNAHVTQLSIKLNESEEFPKDILAFRHLTSLVMSNHHFRKLTDDFSQLNHLKYLSIPDGRFTEFPESIVNLPSLEILRILNAPILLLPPTLAIHPNLKKCEISNVLSIPNVELRSFSGVPPHCEIDTFLGGLTYWGMLLFQYSAIEEMLEHEEYRTHDPNNMGRPSYRSPFSYRGQLSNMPEDHLPTFYREILEGYEDYIYFPRFPLDNGVIGLSDRIYPNFLPVLEQFVLNIHSYNQDTWRTYYARHPVDLAESYVKFGADSTIIKKYFTTAYDLNANPVYHPEIYQSSDPITAMRSKSDKSLTFEERIRLIHESDHHIFSYLKDQLPSTDPIVRAISQRFTLSIAQSEICL